MNTARSICLPIRMYNKILGIKVEGFYPDIILSLGKKDHYE